MYFKDKNKFYSKASYLQQTLPPVLHRPAWTSSSCPSDVGNRYCCKWEEDPKATGERLQRVSTLLLQVPGIYFYNQGVSSGSRNKENRAVWFYVVNKRRRHYPRGKEKETKRLVWRAKCARKPNTERERADWWHALCVRVCWNLCSFIWKATLLLFSKALACSGDHDFSQQQSHSAIKDSGFFYQRKTRTIPSFLLFQDKRIKT